jgi:hypothetical protein
MKRKPRVIEFIYIIILLASVILMWFKFDQNGNFVRISLLLGAALEIILQIKEKPKWDRTEISYLLIDSFTILLIIVHFTLNHNVWSFLIVGFLLRFYVSGKQTIRKESTI